MSETLIHKSKFFWHWEDDKEEAWLQEMAKQGLHLVTPSAFGQYFFASGAPRNMAYRLDFVASGKKDEVYFQLFRDAGWEHIGEMMGWQYWRKEIRPGETAEIFTDAESKIQKYQRVLGFLAIVFLPIFMGVLNTRTYLFNLSAISHWIEWVFAGIGLLILVMFFLYLFIFIRIGMRINQLRRK
jgi:hypothetical protein